MKNLRISAEALLIDSYHNTLYTNYCKHTEHHTMSSLKALDKKVAARKQVYKPILSSPYVNDAAAWPIVNEQSVVLELLKSTILNKCVHLSASQVTMANWPWSLETDYNSIVSLLSDNNTTTTTALQLFLFVCNKDSKHVPSIILQQIPTLAYLSPHDVTLVQLPPGSFELIRNSAINIQNSGLLLLHINDQLDPKFVSAIKERVQQNTSSSSKPWLDDLQHYRSTRLDLVMSTQPLKR